MFYPYLKFIIYLLVAISTARFAYGNFSQLVSGGNKQKLIILIVLWSTLSLACFYLAITNAAKIMFPHLNL